MVKTEVYSWRVSSGRKSALEEAAREEQTSVGALLDRIADQWLQARAVRDVSDDEEQVRLHAAVMRCVGTIAGSDPDGSTKVREIVRARLAKKYGR